MIKSRLLPPRWVIQCAVFALVALSGCSSQPKAPPRPPMVTTFRLTHQVGGTHYRTLIHQDVCYQTFGPNLLVLPKGEAAPIRKIPLGPEGETGPAVDMMIVGDRMFLVLQDDALLELSVADPTVPKIERTIEAARLGIRPRTLSMADGEVFVSGGGGVVRVRDLERVFKTEEIAGRVAKSDNGLVVCVARQVRRMANGRFVGAASDVQELPPGVPNMPPGTLVFVRQTDLAASVGLMSPDVREINTTRATVTVRGVVSSVRVIESRLWVVTDDVVIAYDLAPDALREAMRIEVAGARDVAVVGSNYLAIAGAYGRSIYRIADDERGKGATFAAIIREPSELKLAASDGQHILAGSDLGLWLYLIGSRVELVARDFERPPPPPGKTAATVNANAKVSDDGNSVTISPSSGSAGVGGWVYSEPVPAKIHCVAAIDGEFWIGHDRGLTVLRTETSLEPKGKGRDPTVASAGDRVRARLRIDGPVLYIYPLLVGGGASFVSEYGGFGVARFVDEPVSASTASR